VAKPPLNENTPPERREQQIADFLKENELVRLGFQNTIGLLISRGAPDRAVATVEEQLGLIRDRIDKTEERMIDALRSRPTSTDLGLMFEGMISRMEAYGDEFERLARTPEQVKLAVGFKEWVCQAATAWRAPEVLLAGKMPEPDLGVREPEQPEPSNDNIRRRGR
jgi:hypothetical protein